MINQSSKIYLNRKGLFLISLFLAITSIASSQTIIKPTILSNPDNENISKKTVILSVDRIEIPIIKKSTDTILFPVLYPLRPKLKDEFYFLENFKNIKNSLTLNYPPQQQKNKKPDNIDIKLEYGYDSNIGDNSAPLDNSIALSNNDFKISITNNIIEYYDHKNDLIFQSDLSNFINYEMPSPCDPKVIFDPTANRFILFLQRCDGSYSKSEIMVAFSKTEDPLDGWNFYKMSGNPLKKSGHWFDYPKVGISNQGLYISGNVFNKTKFSEAIVFQFDKFTGFNGEKLKYRVWYDFTNKPFTIKPVSYAFDNTYGDGIYMLSTSWNFSGGPSKDIKLFDITGNIYDETAKIRYFSIPVNPYRFFGHAVQINKRIDNGDIRMQDALFYDNKIFYVFTSGNENNFSRINYNILNLETLVNKSILIGDSDFHSYAYPSLHFLSSENEQTNVVIQYNGTSNITYPDIRAITCDEELNCSDEIIVKKGSSTIDVYDRWGDYSEISKNHNNDKELYFVSSYGKGKKRQSFIGKIIPKEYEVSLLDSIYYTAARTSIDLNFNLKSDKDIQVILNNNGLLSTIYDGKANEGDNVFKIDTGNLEKGNYTMEVVKKNSTKIFGEVDFTIEKQN
tara:strand:+ start:7630 stop:9495 length:1866 start_codon:yes stop_codon:yes gene_type:complete